MKIQLKKITSRERLHTPHLCRHPVKILFPERIFDEHFTYFCPFCATLLQIYGDGEEEYYIYDLSVGYREQLLAYISKLDLQKIVSKTEEFYSFFNTDKEETSKMYEKAKEIRDELFE